MKAQLELVRVFNATSYFNNLTTSEIQKFNQNEPKLNCTYSRKDLRKIKDGACVLNLDESKSIGTHWIALYVNCNTATYLDSIGVEHIFKEIKKSIGNKNIVRNIYRIQAFDSIICGYFCIGFIDFYVKR